MAEPHDQRQGPRSTGLGSGRPLYKDWNYGWILLSFDLQPPVGLEEETLDVKERGSSLINGGVSGPRVSLSFRHAGAVVVMLVVAVVITIRILSCSLLPT